MRAKDEKALGKEGVDAAMRIRDRLVGEGTDKRDVYMGHGFCELGATKFTGALAQMHEFPVMHPGEVVAMIIQDEGVTPQDVAACFEKSGLLQLVHRGPVRPPWPTLREMIDTDQRVLVLAENNAEGVPWDHLMTDVYQETPNDFLLARARACQKERGMIPNLVAVDFYRSGDLIRVVDALNGVEAPARIAGR